MLAFFKTIGDLARYLKHCSNQAEVAASGSLFEKFAWAHLPVVGQLFYAGGVSFF
jgi:hypothetical protein